MIEKTQYEEIMENLTVFRGAFYHDVDSEINQQVVQSIGKKIKKFTSISDDVDVKYIVKSYLPNGQRIPSEYHQLIDFINDGITIPEDAEIFEIEMKVEVRVDGMVLETRANTPLLKTKKFIVKENVDSIVARVTVDDIKNNRSHHKLIKKDELTRKSNKRVRFGKEMNFGL